MKRSAIVLSTLIVLLLTGAVTTLPSLAQNQPPFGQDTDARYAGAVWQAMIEANLVGKDAIWVKPYEGIEPHGAILTTVETHLTVNGHRGTVVVKTNYMGDGADIDSVSNDRDRFLDAYTVMFQREDGYDPDNQNWFWVKYLADGSLDRNPAGMRLAGQVAKRAGPDGDDAGCIACHKAAPGEDYLFVRD